MAGRRRRRALGYTQSAVSRQVAAMEQAAGAPLFERLARGVRPTGAGSVLLRHAGLLLERVDAATLELAGLSDRLEGRLAVGAFPSALAALVPRALARLLRAHPAVVVTLCEGSTPTHLRRLRAGRLELAVIALDPHALPALDGLRAERLLEGRLLVAVPAAHRLAQRTIPSGIRLVAVDEPQPVLRSIVAVTRPERSPSALALLRALREEAALIAETTRQALEP